MAESHRDEIAKLEALYASNPDGRVFTHLAEAYRRAGELGRAREILSRGLQRHPDYASAHVVLGRTLVDQGLDSEAAASFKRVLELDPENLIARRSLAESDRAGGRDAEALVHYRELLAHDPSDDELRATVAELETRLNPPARPAAPPPAEQGWAASHAEESWEPLSSDAMAPEPLSIDPSMFGGVPAQPVEPEPFATEPAPLDEPLSLDSVSFDSGAHEAGGAFDLGTVDFGGGELPPADAGLSLADFGDATGQDEPTAAEPGEAEQARREEADEVTGAGLAESELVAGAAEPEPVGSGGAGSDDGVEDPHGWGEWPGGLPDGDVEDVRSEALEAELAPEADAAPEPAASDVAPTWPDTGEDQAAPSGAAFEAEPFDEPALEPAGESAGEQLAETAYEAIEEDADERGEDAPYDGAEEPESAHVLSGGGSAEEALGVPTETLAALYRAQGFPDRAAAVYRALLRERPNDSDLRERARAMEDEALAQRSRQTDVEETREVWVSGGADTWDADERVSATHVWDEDADAEEEGIGSSIGVYFGQLLAWRPSIADGATVATDPSADAAPIEEPAPVADAASPVEAAPDAGPFTFDGTPADTADQEPHVWDIEPDEAEEPRTPFTFDIEPEVVEEADEPTTERYVFEGADVETTEAEPQDATPAEPIEPSAPFSFETDVTDEEPAEPQPFTFETEQDEAGEAPAESLPFSFETEEEEEEPGEPQLFSFEIEEEEDEAPAEPLPFSFDIERDEEPAEPLPFERQPEASSFEADRDVPARMPWDADPAAPEPTAPEADMVERADEETSPPFLIDEPATEAAEPAAEGEMLFLNEAEAVEEQEEGGWDPTVALADVAAPTRSKPTSRSSSGRPAPPAQEEEDEDDDLEMFRSWLQSLKK